jgi:hypothetical protein
MQAHIRASLPCVQIGGGRHHTDVQDAELDFGLRLVDIAAKSRFA